MEKVALITDSTSDLNTEIINRYNIKILPLKIIYKHKEYIDRIDITSATVYNNLKFEVPITSMPSIKDIDDLFISLIKENYTHAIIIPISSGLSGTINNFKLVSSSHPEIDSFIFDSKSLTMGVGYLVESCGKLLASGKSFNEVTTILPKLRDNIHLYYVVDTLEYLKKGGRIGKVSGTIGDFLNIKPVLSMDKDGKYYIYDKIRGKKQSFNTLIDIVSSFLKKSKCTVYIMHGDALEDAQKLYERISTLTNIKSIFLGDISPAAGVHTGPGLLGIVVIEEYKDE